LVIAKRARAIIAVTLAVIAAFSVVQMSGFAPGFAYANQNLTATASLVQTSQVLNSTAQTSSQITSASQANTTESSTVIFLITPPMQSIVAGDYARFDINVSRPGMVDVLLVTRGIPVHSYAIFAPQGGVANPQFHSTLAIVTSTDTPAGNYNITVVALLNGQEYPAFISLQLASNTTTTQTSANTSPSPSLSLGVDTGLHFYEPNSTVAVRGHLTDTSGEAVANASVSVQVDDSTGAQLTLMNNLTTDAAGIYHAEVKLSPDAAIGTYTVFVSSSKSGYAGATTHTTFVVGSSLTPSVVISQVYITDTTGKPSGVFSVGQTVLVWVIVQNNGAQFQGVIWVQILDSNGTPESIQLQISPLATGTSVKIGFGFTASADLPRGIYSANALVSDKLISQGGTFLASAKAQFALTG
jgi:hypothetical protein